MKALQTLFAVLLLTFSSASFAGKQSELPFAHPDEVLQNTTVYSSNIEMVDFQNLPSKVKATARDVEMPFELGDGYYGVMASAIYRVYDEAGTTVGYMLVDLLTYTEDPDFYLVAAYINNYGIRLGEVHQQKMFSGPVRDWIEEVPEELSSQVNLDDYR